MKKWLDDNFLTLTGWQFLFVSILLIRSALRDIAEIIMRFM